MRTRPLRERGREQPRQRALDERHERARADEAAEGAGSLGVELGFGLHPCLRVPMMAGFTRPASGSRAGSEAHPAERHRQHDGDPGEARPAPDCEAARSEAQLHLVRARADDHAHEIPVHAQDARLGAVDGRAPARVEALREHEQLARRRFDGDPDRAGQILQDRGDAGARGFELDRLVHERGLLDVDRLDVDRGLRAAHRARDHPRARQRTR